LLYKIFVTVAVASELQQVTKILRIVISKVYIIMRIFSIKNFLYKYIYKYI